MVNIGYAPGVGILGLLLFLTPFIVVVELYLILQELRAIRRERNRL